MEGQLQVRGALASDLPSVLRIAADNPRRRFEGADFWTKVTTAFPELSLVIEEGNHVAGWTIAWPDSVWWADMSRLRFNLMVERNAQGRGLGSTLLRTLEEAVRSCKAHQLRAMAWRRESEALDFLEKHGFTEHHRMILSRVTVTDANVTRMETGLSKAVKQGFTFQSCPLRGSDDGTFWEELNNVHNAVMASMPLYYDDPSGASTPDGFKEFVNGGQYPNLDGRLFVARNGSNLVGYATVYVEGARLHQGFTGVHPSFRRRDLALALKAFVFHYASAQGLAFVDTGSRSNNSPILELNRSLGFEEEEEAEIRLWKKLN